MYEMNNFYNVFASTMLCVREHFIFIYSEYKCDWFYYKNFIIKLIMETTIRIYLIILITCFFFKMLFYIYLLICDNSSNLCTYLDVYGYLISYFIMNVWFIS